MKEREATKHRGKIYTKINVVPTPISGSFTGYPGMMTRAHVSDMFFNTEMEVEIRAKPA